MRLALGTVQFGMNYGLTNEFGQVSTLEAKAIINFAQQHGMDTLDTAVAYGDSEEVLGDLGINNWKVITKLPAVPDDCTDIEQWVHDQIRQSMARLNVKQLYGVLLHHPSQLQQEIGRTLYSALQDIKFQKLSTKIGISIYGTDELRNLFDQFTFDLVQAPFNILDRNLVESGWACRLHKAGIEVHTRSCFLQGLLLLPPNKRPAKFNRWSDIWKTWDLWLAREGITALEACLRYVCNFSSIDRVVVGVNSLEQLVQIIRASEGKLSSIPQFNDFHNKQLINPASWSQL